jgi:hypothetical protein
VIRFACPTCLKKLRAPEKATGQKVHCPRCTQLIIIPIPAEVKNIPKLGLLLPGVGSTTGPQTEPDSSLIEHSFADISSEIQFNLLDLNEPPPVRQEPNTKILEDDTTSFVSEGQPIPQVMSDAEILESEVLEAEGVKPDPLTGHLPQPDTSDEDVSRQPSETNRMAAMTVVAAIVIFLLFFMLISVQWKLNQQIRLKIEPLGLKMSWLRFLKVVTPMVVISAAVICMITAWLSLRPAGRQHWNAIGLCLNASLIGLVLIYILF